MILIEYVTADYHVGAIQSVGIQPGGTIEVQETADVVGTGQSSGSLYCVC